MSRSAEDPPPQLAEPGREELRYEGREREELSGRIFARFRYLIEVFARPDVETRPGLASHRRVNVNGDIGDLCPSSILPISLEVPIAPMVYVCAVYAYPKK